MSNGDVPLSAILLERGIAAGLSIATISVSAFGGSFQLKKAAKFAPAFAKGIPLVYNIHSGCSIGYCILT